MEHWLVLHTKPSRERQVAAHLRQRQFEVYLPLVPVSPVNPRAAHQRAYFPRYLFVKVDLQNAGVDALQWTPGLSQVVQFGGQPAIVSDHFVFELKRRLDQIRAAGGLAFDELARGDRVKIVSGPFAGYEAVFDTRRTGSERVRVLLGLIQHRPPRRPVRSAAENFGGRARCIPVELNASAIKKVTLKPH